jgi:transcriptional regulator with XRE-family HTH domain
MQSNGEHVNEIPRMSEFAERLRAARRNAGLSQEGFGALGGVSRNAQFTYESGTRYPDVDYLLRLAASGTDITYLLTGQKAAALMGSEETRLLDAFAGCTSEDRERLVGLADRLAQLGPRGSAVRS